MKGVKTEVVFTVCQECGGSLCVRLTARRMEESCLTCGYKSEGEDGE